MTFSYIIGIAAIVVSSVTAIIVAYYHRRQMRQIEAFRVDPTVGLKPPPTPLRSFLSRNLTLIVGVGLPGIPLALLLTEQGQITHWTIFSISVAVGAIFFALSAYLLERLIKIIKDMARLIG